MQRAQPSQPNIVNVSLRKIDDRIAHITTESAPRGVCRGEQFGFTALLRRRKMATDHNDGLNESVGFGLKEMSG